MYFHWSELNFFMEVDLFCHLFEVLSDSGKSCQFLNSGERFFNKDEILKFACIIEKFVDMCIFLGKEARKKELKKVLESKL